MDSDQENFVDANVFDPFHVLFNSRSNDDGLVVISHNNESLNYQSIYDLWNNATIRASTTSGYPFCEKIVKYYKHNEKEIDPFVDGLKDFPYPNVLVTSSQLKIPSKFQGKVVYSNPYLTGNERDFDELQICIQSVLVELKHHPSLEASMVVVLIDKKSPSQDFILYGELLLKLRNMELSSTLPVYLLFCESLICLIPSGTSVIITRNHTVDWCGLVPMGNPATVTTTGLKWNLNNEKMEFNDLISTSNKLESDSDVEIKTNSPLIWSMALKY